MSHSWAIERIPIFSTRTIDGSSSTKRILIFGFASLALGVPGVAAREFSGKKPDAPAGRWSQQKSAADNDISAILSANPAKSLGNFGFVLRTQNQKTQHLRGIGGFVS
jgi:hypothetical protein